MCDPISATLGVVGAIGSVAASNSAKSAAKAQANAVTQASSENIALAREQYQRNYELFSQYLGDENLAQAYLEALQTGQSTYRPPATYGANGQITNQPAPITITRDQVMQQIEGTPLAQLANEAFAARNQITDQGYASEDAFAQSYHAPTLLR